MTDLRARTGRTAEAIAAQHLEAAGFIVEARNWSCRGGELDVVAARGPLIVFVEVRSATTDFLASPTLTVSAAKQARVGRAADAYLRGRARAPRDIRFDVIGVVFGLDGTRVEHLVDAFVPPWAF